MDWKRVMFTDSKYWTFQFSNRGNAKKAWVDSKAKPIKYTAKDKHQLHAYAGITYYGATSLIFVSVSNGHSRSTRSFGSKGVGAEEYCTILEDKLLPEAQRLFRGNIESFVFQQDGAPPHTAKRTMTLFE